ncbi:coiled-coil domain-containing protein 92-like [Xenopus laevis]|uniref:Coiled-coil domain-containing protein 92-like n=1 Tax=Xenopus laevis TaxID=8355 RepID=A0A8J1M812_XENLA|nr:coiled-coil domain-containing protein 92-like [Xenopus laevis]XP_041437783.1 coiled-coil domain-containing protein 92-like [Xenopus laevis]
MMETQSLEQQLERNIAFLKQGQLELVHDLHQEILRLQKRCTELTMELESQQVELSQQAMQSMTFTKSELAQGIWGKMAAACPAENCFVVVRFYKMRISGLNYSN